MTLFTEDQIVKRVLGTSFSLINPDEFRKYSVCEVTLTDLYCKNKEPKFQGINDPRMGIIDNHLLCETCKNTMQECPGHFGHIELTLPVYNPLFINKVITILNIVCSNCSLLLVDETLAKKLLNKTKKTDNNITLIYKANSQKTTIKCLHCHHIQSNIKYTKKDGMLITKTFTDAENNKFRNKFYANEALDILKKISDQDVKTMGMNPQTSHPSWLIFQVFPVVPPCVRPSINFGCNLRSEDDIVYKLINLIKANKSLEKKLRSPNQKYIDVYKEQLQLYCTTVIDNNIKTIPQLQHRNNRPLKSLIERMKGKDGRIRNNITGKRVDYSARTVIDPDPCIGIEEVGIPFEICKILTFPEVVNDYNKEFLHGLIRNGPDIYPGANYIHQKYSPEMTRYLKFGNNDRIVLQNGDIVHRHLLDSDFVLFNRQPSLHRMSMMGHRVKPLPGKSFRLNPAVTSPYNADFDGDEMNVIAPQNILSMLEISQIACVSEQIISPQSGSPIIGNIMDNILGAYLLTEKPLEIDENLVSNVILKLPQFNGILPPPEVNGKYWSGHQLFSLLFPTMNNQCLMNYHEKGLKIVNGKLISGVLNKQTIGASNNGLIHYIMQNYDAATTAKFINDVQSFTNRYLQFIGFSVGYDDIKRCPALQSKTSEIIESCKKNIAEYIEQIYKKKSKLSMDDFEQHIFNTLNKTRDNIGSIVMKSIHPSNSFYQMINSKAKGNILNISQILGAVGQQNLQWRGKQGRVPLIVNNRTLPYFHQYDASPTARGFIEQSYADGLQVWAFFFHMQAGREGVVDTACKTAHIGYISRKLIKSLEDIKICYDQTLRNEGNRIVQFAYGTNNTNTTKLIKIKSQTMDKEKFQKTFKWPKIIRHSSNYLKIEYRDLKHYFHFHTTQPSYQAINIPHIIAIAAAKQGIEVDSQQLAIYIAKKVQGLDDIIKLNCNPNFPFDELNQYNLRSTRAFLRFHLASKKLIEQHLIRSISQFDWIIKRIIEKFYQSIIEPGTAVGPIAAQSISEPCTQLSIPYDTDILLRIQKQSKTIIRKIGPIVDQYMTKFPKQVIQLSKSSFVLPYTKNNLWVPTIDYQTGQMLWKPVIEFSKHPLNGKLIKITTNTGKQVTATLAHSFVTRKNGQIQTIRGDQLKIGDIVPVFS